jgi:hypothetical protein
VLIGLIISFIVHLLMKLLIILCTLSLIYLMILALLELLSVLPHKKRARLKGIIQISRPFGSGCLFFDLMKSNPEYRDSYVILKKLYRAEIRLAKIKENDNFILSLANKSKSAWKVINAETNRMQGQNKDIPIAPNDLNNFLSMYRTYLALVWAQ